MNVDMESRQKFIDEYNALCLKYGLQLMAVMQTRALSKQISQTETGLDIVAIEGWSKPEQKEQ